MKTHIVLAASIVALLTTASLAAEIGGITMPDRLQADGRELALNGAGVRTKFFMDMYVAGLYLGQKQGDAGRILDADEPMAIRLHIISGLITAEKMEAATREGFVNATGGATAPLAPRIEQFIAVFKEKISTGDTYEFAYDPKAGTAISKNGKRQALIPGADFKKALFGIWLCGAPAQASLKAQMLGR
jgi:hypothetical protein